MAFQQKLLKWFDAYSRPLPWRRRYRPYEVWISEIMLQQTQMETVLPYYERWMKAFPDVETLAAADPERVLKHWQGLGYYSRARNLHANAKKIVSEFGGVFPSHFDTILSLKGVGRYTAGAIASIAFNEEKPIVDGNVLRVLSRIYAIAKPVDVAKNREEFWKLQEVLIPKGHAREFNQALMELGALVCLPANPLCAACPVKSGCEAFRTGTQDDYPVKQNRKKAVRVEASAVILEKEGRFLIHRRPEGAIMGGLWEFPEWKLARDKKMTADEIERKTKRLAEKEFSASLSITRIGAIKRNYTHHLETLNVYSASTPSSRSAVRTRANWPHAWITKKELEKYPFSSAHSKIAGLF